MNKKKHVVWKDESQYQPNNELIQFFKIEIDKLNTNIEAKIDMLIKKIDLYNNELENVSKEIKLIKEYHNKYYETN